jgi:hypothetical protein
MAADHTLPIIFLNKRLTGQNQDINLFSDAKNLLVIAHAVEPSSFNLFIENRNKLQNLDERNDIFCSSGNMNFSRYGMSSNPASEGQIQSRCQTPERCKDQTIHMLPERPEEGVRCQYRRPTLSAGSLTQRKAFRMFTRRRLIIGLEEGCFQGSQCVQYL